MVTWAPPGHWTSERRQAHNKSIEFLRTIVAQNEHMDLDEPKAIIPGVYIQGVSGRWYWIDISIHDDLEWLEGHGTVEETVFSLHVLGATCRQDLEEENVYATSICIGPNQNAKELPVGDQIAALALSLRNDTTTSLRIPLLAQFIVQPREMLREVCQFAHEGVMMVDDVWLGFEPEDDAYDDSHMPHPSLPSANLVQWMEEQLRLNELEEQMAYDAWMANQEEQVEVKEGDVPWHHDEAKVWELEDNLRNGRT
ncbi:MAG: hypothetical protein ISP84_00295 [Candidatus Poseidonia sp.]|jgi:hypothetical protein|nr:hypothetical protein [Poseidonia sp.]